ncbi:hypothetical protein DS884_09095 [Tenacibaculum sp. E3R01]|uniref:CHAT domain-containing protein n=1 Tax=Tenacibaculum sp. E3R01 TaxID=2267227 RepID=UPI000DE9DB12|nr:CHAT domain-containing tetratricopeptide repeat protein [Tenacibaculum sp. E3R01]RBW58020.1 hypothetical protein DS884_09095 [Tenacibaculum sp. E3R01]
MKFKYTILPFFFYLLTFFGISKLNAQYSYKEILTLIKKNKLVLNEKKVDSILTSIRKKDTLYAEAAHGFSFYYYKKKQNYDLAIKYGNLEVETFENLRKNNRQYTNALYNLGKFHFLKNDYNKAITFFLRAVDSNAFPLKVAQSYCWTGKMFFFKGEYYKSIDYYLKGIPLLEKCNSKRSLISNYNNLSLSCNKINTGKSVSLGISFLKKGDSIIRNNPNLKISNNSFYALNVGFANLYSLKHQYNYEKAKHHYLRNLKRATINDNKTIIANSYLNLGELYLNKKNDSCLYFFNQSLKYDLKDKTESYETYRNISNYFLSKHQLDRALKNVNLSLNHSFKTTKSNQINNLSFYEVLNTRDKKSIILALKAKTTIFIKLFQRDKKKSYLQKAINNVELTNKIANILINFSTEANTKYLWRKEISETFNLGIYTAYLLNDSKLMFELMEKNKAFLLALNINENIKLTNLPDEVSRKNNLFKKNIFQLESETEIHKASKKKDSLFDLKVSYQNFKDSIQKIYPQFSNQNNNIKQVSFNQVKSNLHKNDIKLYYTLNASNVDDDKQSMIGLLISKNKDIHFKIKNIDSVLLGISAYKKLISKPLTQKQELARFKKVSYSLYNQLLPTKKIKDLIKNKNISIVSDVSLENIPFEAFNTSASDLRYLVNDCNISYSYSSSFSEFNKNRVRKTNTDIAVFAPVNFKNTELSSLKNTEKEATLITNLVGGDSFTNSNATKDNFVRKTSNAKIIHLATHATATNNPSIQFFTNDLKLHELYTYKNNADLVVLSACETNIGELKQGEGVLNLARGFFHSGANAVVSSTWKINDASSSFIMKEFYINLKDKQSKSEALNNAKRAYLKKHSLSEQSPYYWASFVLIGDTSPVFTTHYFYYVGIVLIIGLLLFFYFKRK